MTEGPLLLGWDPSPDFGPGKRLKGRGPRLVAQRVELIGLAPGWNQVQASGVDFGLEPKFLRLDRTVGAPGP